MRQNNNLQIPLFTRENLKSQKMLSERDLAILEEKLYKKGRTKKDMEEVERILIGKKLLTYIVPFDNLFARTLDNVACEGEFLAVYTSMETLEKHLDQLDRVGMIGEKTIVKAITFESLVERAHVFKTNLLLDKDLKLSGKYFCYDIEKDEMTVKFFSR